MAVRRLAPEDPAERYLRYHLPDIDDGILKEVAVCRNLSWSFDDIRNLLCKYYDQQVGLTLSSAALHGIMGECLIPGVQNIADAIRHNRTEIAQFMDGTLVLAWLRTLPLNRYQPIMTFREDIFRKETSMSILGKLQMYRLGAYRCTRQDVTFKYGGKSLIGPSRSTMEHEVTWLTKAGRGEMLAYGRRLHNELIFSIERHITPIEPQRFDAKPCDIQLAREMLNAEATEPAYVPHHLAVESALEHHKTVLRINFILRLVLTMDHTEIAPKAAFHMLHAITAILKRRPVPVSLTDDKACLRLVVLACRIFTLEQDCVRYNGVVGTLCAVLLTAFKPASVCDLVLWCVSFEARKLLSGAGSTDSPQDHERNGDRRHPHWRVMYNVPVPANIMDSVQALSAHYMSNVVAQALRVPANSSTYAQYLAAIDNNEVLTTAFDNQKAIMPSLARLSLPKRFYILNEEPEFWLSWTAPGDDYKSIRFELAQTYRHAVPDDKLAKRFWIMGKIATAKRLPAQNAQLWTDFLDDTHPNKALVIATIVAWVNRDRMRYGVFPPIGPADPIGHGDIELMVDDDRVVTVLERSLQSPLTCHFWKYKSMGLEFSACQARQHLTRKLNASLTAPPYSRFLGQPQGTPFHTGVNTAIHGYLDCDADQVQWLLRNGISAQRYEAELIRGAREPALYCYDEGFITSLKPDGSSVPAAVWFDSCIRSSHANMNTMRASLWKALIREVVQFLCFTHVPADGQTVTGETIEDDDDVAFALAVAQVLPLIATAKGLP
ncbi:hypothetical protein DOTSEDRAFT_23840 [Dothistroma septosporum NZE10]|uniref:Uncharacterized protein n=1 Tax=Dothistroma septosporum (strain NZE10 / CBS 128990) TaxID=675120 RepID=N1PU40_DOTSN|nr:hypothetical protein DOTSEDRAFT_23840 [Dothistroma septosporum NZE10]